MSYSKAPVEPRCVWLDSFSMAEFPIHHCRQHLCIDDIPSFQVEQDLFQDDDICVFSDLQTAGFVFHPELPGGIVSCGFFGDFTG